jgi:hypothetical protein
MRRFFSEREGVGDQLPRLGGSSGLSMKASNPTSIHPSTFIEAPQPVAEAEPPGVPRDQEQDEDQGVHSPHPSVRFIKLPSRLK